MKRTKFIFLALVIVMASSCSSRRLETATPAPTPAGFGQDVSTPCVEESYDDSQFFRGLGTGTSTNIGNARSAALRAAQSEINAKLGGFVNGLTTDYNRTMAGDSGERTQRAMEGELDRVIEKFLNDAHKICERTLQDQRGTFNTFIVLEIPKEELVKQMENSLSENEELHIEFNREQFREYARKRLESMQNR